MATFKENAVKKENVFGGSARLLYANPSTEKPTKLSDIIDLSNGTLKSGWNDFGSTDGGLTIKRGFEKEERTVDQILGAIDEFITKWSMSVEFSCAETTLENIKMAWEGGAISVESSTHEKTLGIGAKDSVEERMVAFLVDKRKKNGTDLVRGYVFWKAKWDGSESEHSYRKGEKTLIPMNLTILADPTAGKGKEFGIILDQNTA